MAKFRDLKASREKGKLTQAQLAEMAEVSAEVVQELENGGQADLESVEKIFLKLNAYYNTHMRTSIPASAAIRENW